MYLSDWMDEVSEEGFIWYVKRLSGNDTLANGSHQAGPYMPKSFLFEAIPAIHDETRLNPDTWVNLYVASHDESHSIRAIWYNNKLFGGTRNESRLTGFGGMESAILDPENTGAIAVFAFEPDRSSGSTACQVWICRHAEEEELLEERFGQVEPGESVVIRFGQDGTWSRGGSVRTLSKGEPRECWLSSEELPEAWLTAYPSGLEIVRKAIELRPMSGFSADSRLVERRDCEFLIFQSIEEAVELPAIRQGFDDIPGFLERAQSILQRRKARAGRSLELHAREIFIEDGLIEGRDFDHQPESEPNKHPDFLFPGQSEYRNASFPATALRMLAVKTTCKDRWRQVINEADRIETKHLLTLQEGVSLNQYREMTEAGVKLVVPASLKSKYPAGIRPELLSFAEFMGETRNLS